MKKRKINPDDIGIYLDVDWKRKYKSRNLGVEIELSMYKGYVMLAVDDVDERARALAAHASIRVGASAWMRIADIDALITLLREGRRMLKLHRADIAKVAACEDCSHVFGGVCDAHRHLFKKYKLRKRRESRGLR